MTALDIIKQGLSLVYETPVTDADAQMFSTVIIQTLITECYEAEQNSRDNDNQLTAIPAVKDGSGNYNTIPYNDYLLTVTLPYGVAWKWCEANEKEQGASMYYSLYEQAKHIGGGGKWNLG